jgi:cell division protease FtsH
MYRSLVSSVRTNTGLNRLLCIAIACSIVLMLAGCVPAAQNRITLGDAISLSKSGDISKVIVDTNTGTMTMTASVGGTSINITGVDGNAIVVTNGTQLVANIDSLNVASLQQLGFVLPAEYSTTAISSTYTDILIFILPLIFIFVVLFFLMRVGRGAQNQVMSFSRSRARLVSGDKPRVTFADVAGADEAKEDLQEVVEFLKNRWKFQSIGAKIPKGVLLVGPPRRF